MTDEQQARIIIESTSPEEKIGISYADPSMWASKNLIGNIGSSADEYMEEGIPITKADNDRLSGKRKVHRQLSRLGDGYSGLWVFPQCNNLIRELGNLALDVEKLEDVDSDQDDHAYRFAIWFD